MEGFRHQSLHESSIMGISIGKVIQYCRNSKNMTQKELAADQLSVRYISKIEKGEANLTVDILSYISKKLATNLFTMYGKMNEYETIETYSACQMINDAIGRHSIDDIECFCHRYENDKRFQQGIEKTVLGYARALMLSNHHEYEAAVSAAEAACSKPFNCDEGGLFRSETIFSTEYALALSHAVNLCRINESERGIEELLELYKAAMKRVDSGLAEVEGDEDFYINILCSCLYNIYVFSNRVVVEEIDNLLDMQKKKGKMHMVCELLLCKSAYLMVDNKVKEALKVYSSAKAIGLLFYPEKFYTQRAMTTINIKSDYSLFEKETS